jgi:hypothetical protein
METHAPRDFSQRKIRLHYRFYTEVEKDTESGFAWRQGVKKGSVNSVVDKPRNNDKPSTRKVT